MLCNKILLRGGGEHGTVCGCVFDVCGILATLAILGQGGGLVRPFGGRVGGGAR